MFKALLVIEAPLPRKKMLAAIYKLLLSEQKPTAVTLWKNKLSVVLVPDRPHSIWRMIDKYEYDISNCTETHLVGPVIKGMNDKRYD